MESRRNFRPASQTLAPIGLRREGRGEGFLLKPRDKGLPFKAFALCVGCVCVSLGVVGSVVHGSGRSL